MKRRLVIVAIALVLLIPMTIIMIFFETGGIFTCDSERSAESRSPDDRIIATVYLVECGSTTPSATHLELVAVGEAPEGSSTVLVVEGAVELELEWISSASLRVRNLNDPVAQDDIYTQESSWRDVEIEFEGLRTSK
jgi:hypothetical protein